MGLDEVLDEYTAYSSEFREGKYIKELKKLYENAIKLKKNIE